jgi:hypothetical protein
MSYSVDRASFRPSSLERGVIGPLPVGTVGSSLTYVPATDPRPLPLVLALLLIVGLSLGLWAGIGRIVGALTTG